MQPDDPRHGTRAGYVAGCRDQCCRDGAARYQRHINYDHHRGIRRSIDARGLHRRVQALACLGWTISQVADECGRSHQWLVNVLAAERVFTTTHDAVAEAYERMCMTLPPDGCGATRARNRAAKNGWAPPLAWDDIDRDKQPATDGRVRIRRQLDTVLVDRIVAGQHHLIAEATVAEREEVVARMRAAGLPLRPLEVAGINVTRYRKEDAA